MNRVRTVPRVASTLFALAMIAGASTPMTARAADPAEGRTLLEIFDASWGDSPVCSFTIDTYDDYVQMASQNLPGSCNDKANSWRVCNNEGFTLDEVEIYFYEHSNKGGTRFHHKVFYDVADGDCVGSNVSPINTASSFLLFLSS